MYYIRGATLIRVIRALCDVPSHIRQLTYACTSGNTRRIAPLFPALNGPNQTFCNTSGSQLTRTLCTMQITSAFHLNGLKDYSIEKMMCQEIFFDK